MALSRVRNWWKWVIGIFLFFLIAAQIFFSFILGPIVKTAASKSVAQNTRGLYSLEALSVQWSLLNRTFSMTGVEIAYDSTRFDSLVTAGQARPILITLHIPSIEITFLDLYRVIRYNDAHIRSVKIYDCDLQVFSFPERVTEKSRFRPEQLYEIISEFVQTLQISQLQMVGGTLTYNHPGTPHENAFTARDISFEMTNFRIDSATVPEWDRPFFADKISAQMNIEDYSFVLPDSSYVIRVGKLGVSTLTKEIFAENIRIQPGSKVWGKTERHESIDINIPQLLIEGVPLYQAWFERKLDLAHVRIIEPVILRKNKPGKSPEISANFDAAGVFEKIIPWFDRITAKEMTVEGGLYRQVRDWNDTTGTLVVEGLDLNLLGVKLDSSLLVPNENRLLFSDQIELNFTHLRTRLSKGNYTLRAGPARVSAPDGVFFLKNLNLRATTEKFAQALTEGGDVVSLNVPQVSLYGLDLPRVWYDRVLSVGWVEIREPLAELINQPQVKREVVDSLAQSNLYSLVEDELRSFSIRNFFVKGGRFNFNTSTTTNDNEFAASDINVHIKNFRLSPDTTLRRENPWYADDISIKGNIANYSFLLPDSSYAIQATSIGISTGDSAIYAESVKIIPRDTLAGQNDSANHNHIHGFIPRVYLSGLNLRQIWLYKTLDIDSVHLSQPRIDLHSSINYPHKAELLSLDSIDLYPYIASKLNALEVHKLVVDSAAFSRVRAEKEASATIDIPSMDIKISDFKLTSDSHIGPENFLFSKDIQVTVHGIEEILKDSVHTISTGEIYFSTAQKKITISEIHISPDESQAKPTAGNLYRFYSPNLTIEGLNSYELYQEKILDLERVAIYDPELSLVNYPDLGKNEIDSLAKGDLYLLISDQLHALRIQSFLVMNGVFKFNEDNHLSESTFTAKDIVVLISNFQLDSAARKKTNNPFYADDIDIGMSIRDYSFMLPDSSYTITIGDIGISTSDSSITAEEIQITPKTDHPANKNTDQLFDVFIPSVRLAGLRANELYFDRVLNLSAFTINRPRISMFSQKANAPKRGMENIRLYETMEKYFHRVALDSFSIENGIFEQILPEGDTTLPLLLPGFTFRLYRFIPDPLNMVRPGRMLFSDDFEFTVDSYTLPLKDSLYLLTLHNLKVNSSDESVTIDSLTMTSNYNVYDYIVEHGYTIDYFELNTGQIQFDDADLYALLQNRDIIARQIHIEQPNLLIRKDKRFSQDPDRRPPVPQDLLKSLSFRIDVDSIVLSQGIVNYFERVDRVDRPGFIYLNSIHAVLKNATNNPEKLLPSKKTEMSMRAQALVKGEGKLEMVFHYPLGDTANPYTFEGTAGPMDLTSFNSILEPAAGVRVASGQATDLAFRVRGTARAARGKMWFEYENLKVSVVEEKIKEDEENQISQRGFATAMANALVVRARNPKRRILRVGRIEYEADPSKVFVAHWLRALLSGVKSSIGMEGKDENVEKED
ncbi:MAG: hypothetical protein R3D00_09400 [Bacteroidia bacterium]